MTSYQLLPFTYQKTDHTYILVNVVGEFAFISEDDFKRIVSGTFDKLESLDLLMTKHFLAPKQYLSETIDILKIKYRTKRNYMRLESLLLMVVPTLGCNCTCIYCQASSQEKMDRKNTMSFKTALSFCNFINILPHSSIKIEFQGGEPTLAFDLIEFIVTRAKRLNDKKIDFVICTNLLVLSKRELAFIISNKISISTSLDGPESTHNLNRPSRSFNSPFAKTSENIKTLRQYGVYPSGLVTITQHNLRRMIEVIDSYIDQGFNSIFIRPLNPYGLAYKNHTLDYAADEYNARYNEAIEYILNKNESGISFREEMFSIIARKILTPFNDGFVDMQNPSALGSMCMIVNQCGNIYPSDEARMISSMGDDTWNMGNVKRIKSFDDIDKSRKKIIENSITEMEPMCSFCAFYAYCTTDPVKKYFEATNKETSRCKYMKNIFLLLMGKIRSDNRAQIRIIREWANV